MNSMTADLTIRQVSNDYHKDDDISIVGGGVSGLASAYFLIEAGHEPEKITIFERNDYLGGHARTLYLHQVSDDELYVIQNYQLEFSNSYQDIFLCFIDHTNAEQRVQVNGNPLVVPVDIGVCGFSVNYHNFQNLLSELHDQAGIPFLQYDYLEEVSRAISLDDLVLRSDKILGGQLWHPKNWYRVYRLKRDIKKVVAYCENRGLPYLQTKTIQELLDELKAQSISQDALDLLCAFCQVGSGYTNTQFLEISAGYLYTFFMQGNFNNAGENNTTFIYGVSVYLNKLIAYLQSQGVNFRQEDGIPAKHTVYAVQPYDALKVSPELPEVTRSKSLLYVHCDQSVQGSVNTVLSYGVINGIAQATWDLDRMRPDHPDVGAYITFTIPDHEMMLDGKLFDAGQVQTLNDTLGNGHNLYESPLKKVWQHAVIDVPAEKARHDIWENHQGTDDTYYCSSSYLNCMLHENAITSALDVACLLTGEHDRLAEHGFVVSDQTRDIYST